MHGEFPRNSTHMTSLYNFVVRILNCNRKQK